MVTISVAAAVAIVSAVVALFMFSTPTMDREARRGGRHSRTWITPRSRRLGRKLARAHGVRRHRRAEDVASADMRQTTI